MVGFVGLVIPSEYYLKLHDLIPQSQRRSCLGIKDSLVVKGLCLVGSLMSSESVDKSEWIQRKYNKCLICYSGSHRGRQTQGRNQGRRCHTLDSQGKCAKLPSEFCHIGQGDSGEFLVNEISIRSPGGIFLEAN